MNAKHKCRKCHLPMKKIGDVLECSNGHRQPWIYIEGKPGFNH